METDRPKLSEITFSCLLVLLIGSFCCRITMLPEKEQGSKEISHQVWCFQVGMRRKGCAYLCPSFTASSFQCSKTSFAWNIPGKEKEKRTGIQSRMAFKILYVYFLFGLLPYKASPPQFLFLLLLHPNPRSIPPLSTDWQQVSMRWFLMMFCYIHRQVPSPGDIREALFNRHLEGAEFGFQIKCWYWPKKTRQQEAWSSIG